MKNIHPPEELLTALTSGKNFLIFGHIHPDYDCLGSQTALGLGLQSLGKSVQLIGDLEQDLHPIQKQYTFHMDIPEGWNQENTQIIIVDCHSRDRIAMSELLRNFPLLVIDHHQRALDPLAGITWIEEEAPATAHLVYRIIESLGVEISAEISTLLFQGLAADTGFFRFLKPEMGEIFHIAGDCVDRGVNPYLVHQQIYGGKHVNTPRFIASVLKRMQVLAEGKVIIAYETAGDIDNYGMESRDSAEVYHLLLSIEECEAVVYLKRTENGNTVAGLRSKSFMNMSEVAKKFGGGGHIRAAGFSQEAPPVRVMKQLKPILLRHLKNDMP